MSLIKLLNKYDILQATDEQYSDFQEKLEEEYEGRKNQDEIVSALQALEPLLQRHELPAEDTPGARILKEYIEEVLRIAKSHDVAIASKPIIGQLWKLLLTCLAAGPSSPHCDVISQLLQEEISDNIDVLSKEQVHEVLAALKCELRCSLQEADPEEHKEKSERCITELFDSISRRNNFSKDNKKELQDLLLASIAQCNNSHVHQKLVKQLLKILEVGKMPCCDFHKKCLEAVSSACRVDGFPSSEESERSARDVAEAVAKALEDNKKWANSEAAFLMNFIFDMAAVGEKTCDVLSPLYWPVIDELNPIKKKPEVVSELLQRLLGLLRKGKLCSDHMTNIMTLSNQSLSESCDSKRDSVVVVEVALACMEHQKCQTACCMAMTLLMEDKKAVNWLEHPHLVGQVLDWFRNPMDEDGEDSIQDTAEGMFINFLMAVKQRKALKISADAIADFFVFCLSCRDDPFHWKLGNDTISCSFLEMKKLSEDRISELLTEVLNLVKCEGFFWENTDVHGICLQTINQLIPLLIKSKEVARHGQVLLGIFEQLVVLVAEEEDDDTRKMQLITIALTIITFLTQVKGKESVACPFIPSLCKLLAIEDDQKIIRVQACMCLGMMCDFPQQMAPQIDHILQAYLEERDFNLQRVIVKAYPECSDAVNDKVSAIMEEVEDRSDPMDTLKDIEILKLVAENNAKLVVPYVDFIIGSLSSPMGQHQGSLCLSELSKKEASLLHDHAVTIRSVLQNGSPINPVIFKVLANIGKLNQVYASEQLAAMAGYLSNQDAAMVEEAVKAMLEVGIIHKDPLVPFKAQFEQLSTTHMNPGVKQQSQRVLEYLAGKTLLGVGEQVDTQQGQLNDLDTKVSATQESVEVVATQVEGQGKDMKHVKEDLKIAETKLDQLEEAVEETAEKVEEIDHKTMSNAPVWSRDVSRLLNAEAEHDWRLLAKRLGYSVENIRGWASQADPCMALLSEWYATNKTSEATHAVLQTLKDMGRQDAVEVIERAKLAADEKVCEDEEVEYSRPPPVFISYQWDHQGEVKILKKHLNAAGFDAWMDIGQMGGGDKLFAKIDNGIRAAKVVICCISAKYAESANCNREVHLAVNLGKPIIPLLMEKLSWPPPGAMGPIFGEYLFVRFFQRAHEVTEDNNTYWPAMKLQELLMQLRYHMVPDETLITDEYQNWWVPPEETTPTVFKKKENNKDNEKENISPASNASSQPISTEHSPQIFISYQWGKQPQIRSLYSRLVSLGYTCWLDIHQMGGGDSLYEKIDKGLRGCKVVFSCLTPKYTKSANCRREVSLADALKKPVIPLLLEEMTWPPEGPMSMVFSELLYIPFLEMDPVTLDYWFGKNFDQVLCQVKKYIPEIDPFAVDILEIDDETDPPEEFENQNGQPVQIDSEDSPLEEKNGIVKDQEEIQKPLKKSKSSTCMLL